MRSAPRRSPGWCSASDWRSARGSARSASRPGSSGAQTLLERRARLDSGAITGLLLATCLAAGSVLVSNVFHSSATVDGLLFGSLLGIDQTDIYRALVLDVACVALVLVAGRGLLATSFAPPPRHRSDIGAAATTPCCCCCSARPSSRAPRRSEASSSSGLLVVPAATARLARPLGAAGAGRRRAAGCGRGDDRPRARVPPGRPARRRDRRARRVGLLVVVIARAVVPPPRATASRAGARWRAARGAVPGRGRGGAAPDRPSRHDRGRRDDDAAAGSRPQRRRRACVA